MTKNIKTKKVTRKILNHLTKVGMAIVSASLVVGPAGAIDPTDAASQVIASEGGKEVMNSALKVARSKPALSLGTAIVCISCIPVAGAAASPAMCIACGILITKTFG